MNWFKNWLTTVFGGTVGVPLIIEGLFSKPINWMLVVSGIGAILAGASAKDYNEK